ncbi:MAG: hypothetical protein WBN39_04140 [Flavobacteriaceae bacterium]
MKTTTIIVLLLLFLGSPIAQGQDLLDALKQTAEMHNENRGLEENNDSESSNGEEGNDQPSWEEILAEAEEEYKADINGLDDYQKCFVLMTFCLESFYNLEEKIKEEANCKMKYDGYGLQLLNIARFNTIMYCPEKISNLSNSTQREAYDSYFGPLYDMSARSSTSYPGERIWMSHYYIRKDIFGDEEYSKFPRNASRTRDGSRTDEFIEWMLRHFHPYFTVMKVAEIGEKMEALGCGG